MTLGELKVEMALRGYYTTVDFAPLIGISKQGVSKFSDRYTKQIVQGRPWYQYDNGEHGETLYPSANGFFKKFIDFGFVAKHKGLAFNFNLNVEVKRLSSEAVSLVLHDNLGNALQCTVKKKDVSFIPNEGCW